MAKKKAVVWGIKKIKKLWEGLQSNKETVKKVESQIKNITKENIKKKKFAGFTDPKKLNTAKNKLKKLKAADQKRINILKKGGYAAAGTTAAAITLDALLDKVLKDTPAYTIKKGDTLSEIARDNGTTLKALKEANPQIKDLNKISIGQKINLSPKVKDRKSVYQGMSKSDMASISKNKSPEVVARKYGGQIGRPRGVGAALRGYGKGYK